MIEQDPKKALTRGVMDAIHSGRVQMRPRWKFVLSGVLAALGVAILLFTLLFIVSFAIFTLRQTGALFVPEFGMRGVFVFFAALPFILLALLLVFVIVLEVLVRRYRVGYRTPLLVSVLAILIIIGLGGLGIERTRVHEMILREAMMPGELPPPIAIMYRTGAQHIPDVYRGTIVAMMPGGFVLLDENGAGTTSVLLSPLTQLPPGTILQPSEQVVVFGDGDSTTIRAMGIVQITD
ncbi:MAG: hypothetical protein P4L81_01080 [Candidatus Pacebacteria bacterium]|nr:hypothetical protein [Candidatus Paceibacterota bacterium]